MMDIPSGEKRNDPDVEEATFRFTVNNNGSASVKVERGQFLPQTVETISFDVETKAFYSPIDHQHDISVWLNNPKPDQPVPIPVDITIPPFGAKDFRVWFKSKQTPNIGYLRVTGKLILFYERGQLVANPITVSLASDSKTMHYGEESKP